MKTFSPFSNSMFTLIIAIAAAFSVLFSAAHHGWGDSGLVYFMIAVVAAVAVFGFRLATACEQFHLVLIPLVIVSMPFLTFFGMDLIVDQSNSIISSGILLGWAASVVSVIYGMLVSRTEAAVR